MPLLATIDPWILTFSAITVVLTIGMGFWTARRSKTASDFYVAGRSVSVGWNASAISGEYLSAASFMGVAGMVMSSGYDALWYPVCYACGYLFLLLFIAGPLRRFGAYTIPDFAEGRFDSPVFRKIAVCFVLFIGFFYTMPQMKGAGTTLAYIFPGLPYWAGVVLVGAVITLNVALGGMKGITLVQAFQYWAKMFAISVPIFVLMAVYGHYGKQLELNGESSSSRSRINFNPADFPNAFFKSAGRTTSYGGKLNELRQKARRLGFGKVNISLPSKWRLDLAIALYQKERPSLGDSYVTYLDRGIGNIQQFTLNTSDVAPPGNRLSLPDLRAYIRQVFATNGLTVVDLTANATVIVMTTNLGKYISPVLPQLPGRQPLPDKAPRDETWLLPFGPLTTKAAKAAKRTVSAPPGLDVTNQVNRLTMTWKPASLEEGLRQWTRLVQEKWSHPAAGGKPTLAAHVVRDYVETVVVADPTQWRKEFQIVWSNEVEQRIIRVPPLASSPPSDFASGLKSVLETNGITVVSEPGSVFKAFPTKDAVFTEIDPRPYSLLYTYSLIIALVCGTAGLPHILVRFYTNPDGVAAKRTTMWVMILIGIFYVFPPVFGVMGRNLFPELYSGIGAKGTDKIVLELPRLLNEKYAPLGSILSGITCAGAFAAFMSTFSGLLVSMTGAMAHDVYGRMLRPKATPEQRMRMFKIAAVLIGGVAMLLGSFVEALEINFMVGQAFAIAAASYFPLLFMAAWWRNLTMKGAATGMLAGGLSAVMAISLTSFSTLATAPGSAGEMFAAFKPLNDFWAQYPLLRILAEQPAIWAVPLAIGLMIVVSKLTRKDVPSDIRMKMLVLHAPEKLGLKQEYIQEHQHGH